MIRLLFKGWKYKYPHTMVKEINGRKVFIEKIEKHIYIIGSMEGKIKGGLYTSISNIDEALNYIAIRFGDN